MTLKIIKCNCLSCKISKIKDIVNNSDSLWSAQYWTKVSYLLQYLYAKNNNFVVDRNKYNYLFAEREYYEDLRKLGYLNVN